MDMLGTSLRNESTVSSKQPSADKSVTFIHTQDNRLRVYKMSATRLRLQRGTSLLNPLESLLNVKTRRVFNSDRRNSRILTYKGLLQVVDASDNPVLWLRNDAEPAKIAKPKAKETLPKEDYSKQHYVAKKHCMIGPH